MILLYATGDLEGGKVTRVNGASQCGNVWLAFNTGILCGHGGCWRVPIIQNLLCFRSIRGRGCFCMAQSGHM